MLDFGKLTAPSEDGGVLVEPAPAQCTTGLRANTALLRTATSRILEIPLHEWRRRTQEHLTGFAGQPLVVVGHQPAFIHPGVWVKSFVACRLAKVVGGRAVNLVVDNDAPPHTYLEVPVETGEGLESRRIAFADCPLGRTYEQITVMDPAGIDHFEAQVRAALPGRYDRSLMPTYLGGFRRAVQPRDWADQAVSGRRSIDMRFGVDVMNVRVSRIWWAPFLVDCIVHAERFAAAYNAALADYRRANRIRGANRPIPDLVVDRDLVETPIWAYRRHDPRRRLAIRRAGDKIELLAGQRVGMTTEVELRAGVDRGLDFGPWMLRPRALTLTIWARLFLADLFIHGIGGAKYDRISDAIIQGYYGVQPPAIACVSATLRLKVAGRRPVPALDELLRRARDEYWNPQRHVRDGQEAATLIENRRGAVAHAECLRATEPGNRRARREAFHRIRELTDQIRGAHPELTAHTERLLDQMGRRKAERRIAMGREYFVGLYEPNQLERLAGALPEENDFRV